MLHFSYYYYVPRSVVDQRTVFSLPAASLNSETLARLILDAPANSELALHSLVQIGSDIGHIPMIDLATSARAHLDKLRSVMPNEIFDQMVWFSSGRSFHGYGRRLLTPGGWQEFMGRLLLANPPMVNPIVDPRWVGHRLVAGYSALRWTKNTPHYITYPEIVISQSKAPQGPPGLLGQTSLSR